MKKADLSLNTIVIAAIVLIVLVVIILIFTGRIGGFTKGLSDCTNKGGYGTTGNCNSGDAEIFKFRSEGSPTEDQKCCLPIGKEKDQYGNYR